MRNTSLAFWIVLCGIWGLSYCSDNSPRTTVDSFYKWYLKTQPTGLPSKEQEQMIAPYLSKRLLGLFDEARSYQKTFIRQLPNQKPPWIDGCLFASVFEGPMQFEISGVVKNADGTSAVKVHFRRETYDWEDVVIVRKAANTFVIDDFLLSGAGPFNPPRRLSESLKYRGK